MQPSTCFTGTSSIIGANYKLTKLEIIHYFVISLERKVSLISYVEGIAFSESNENLFQEVSPPNTFFFLGGKNFIKKFSRMIGGGCRCVGSAPTLGSSLDTWKQLGHLEAAWTLGSSDAWKLGYLDAWTLLVEEGYYQDCYANGKI